MGSAKQRISSALILAVGASMLMGCELPERNTQVKSIKIGVTLYDQYDAFLSELMEDFNTYAAAKEEETGIAINVEVYNASQSQATQNNQVEAMAQDGCDIICVNLVDRTDPTTVIDLAEKNDIPVISNNPRDSLRRLLFVLLLAVFLRVGRCFGIAFRLACLLPRRQLGHCCRVNMRRIVVLREGLWLTLFVIVPVHIENAPFTLQCVWTKTAPPTDTA